MVMTAVMTVGTGNAVGFGAKAYAEASIFAAKYWMVLMVAHQQSASWATWGIRRVKIPIRQGNDFGIVEK